MIEPIRSQETLTMKDLKTADPRWCTGCGDYTILVGLRKLMVKHQLDPANTVNISGIGCSGRIPHYMNTYGFHTIHGRAVPVALGVRLAQQNLQVFIHSGDGDSLSIGGNHLLHGISKNMNCVYVLYDNQIYGLTKNQSSPTTKKGQVTETQPKGTWLEPINPIAFALSAGATFVASTMEWNGEHLMETLDLALMHHGFSFVHVAQRCPKYNPNAWDSESTDWMTCLNHKGTYSEKAIAGAKELEHDPSQLARAYELSAKVPDVFGCFYQRQTPCYDESLVQNTQEVPQKDRRSLLEPYRF